MARGVIVRGVFVLEPCQTPHYNKHLHQISPWCLTHYTIRHHGQLNTHYHQNTINIQHEYRLQQNRWTFTNYKKADWTQFTEDTPFVQTTIPTNIPIANIIFTNNKLMVDKHNIPNENMHSNCRLLPKYKVCEITQGNNIRRENTCDPDLKLLNEEITSDIQKPKQNIWKEHLDTHWDHRHNTHILWKTTHGLSNRAPPSTFNKITNTPKHIANCFTTQFTNTQHTKQTDPLTEQHKTYKDTTLHSPLLRSRKQ